MADSPQPTRRTPDWETQFRLMRFIQNPRRVVCPQSGVSIPIFHIPANCPVTEYADGWFAGSGDCFETEADAEAWALARLEEWREERIRA